MGESRAFLRDGDQFDLDLFPGVPWNGRSPRGLTRVGIGLFLRPEPPRHELMDERDPRQFDLWRRMGHTEKKASRGTSRGAPSLLPLKKGRRSRSFAMRTRERGE